MAEIILAFQDRFAPLVMDGRKQQSIRQRKPGKAAPELGDVVWAVSDKVTSSLGKWPVIELLGIEIYLPRGSVRINDTYVLDAPALETLAQQDGFTCWADMLQWFRTQYAGQDVFDGIVIGWRFQERLTS